MPRHVPGYDSGRETPEKEKGEKPEKEEEEEDESVEMPPLRHRGKLILKNVRDIFHDHNQALHERMDKQEKWHRNTIQCRSRLCQNQQNL